MTPSTPTKMEENSPSLKHTTWFFYLDRNCTNRETQPLSSPSHQLSLLQCCVSTGMLTQGSTRPAAADIAIGKVAIISVMLSWVPGFVQFKKYPTCYECTLWGPRS